MPDPAPAVETGEDTARARLDAALEALSKATTSPARAAASDAVVLELDALLEDAGVPAPDDVADDPDARLTAALAAAQGAFPAIAKNKTATVTARPGKASYSYMYADLSDVLAAVRPVLARHGLALVQRTVREERGIALVTELRHVGGGIIATEVDLGQSSSNPQAFGGALTYLRRYEAVTLLGIAAEEDTDAQHVEPAGRGGNGGPSWAAAANAAGERELVGVIGRLVQHDETAAQYVDALRNACGGVVPSVVASWLAALPKWREAGLAAKNATPAPAAAAEQDRAAEAPDTPAPDDDPPSSREAADRTVGGTATVARATCGSSYRGSPTVRCVKAPGHDGDHQAAGGGQWAESMDGGGTMAQPEEEPPAAPRAEEPRAVRDNPELSDAELEEARAAAALDGVVTDDLDTMPGHRAADGTDVPSPAGTVEPPNGLNVTDGSLERATGPTAAAIAKKLREAGCICTEPLKRAGDDDACPIRGHGIPF